MEATKCKKGCIHKSYGWDIAEDFAKKDIVYSYTTSNDRYGFGYYDRALEILSLYGYEDFNALSSEAIKVMDTYLAQKYHRLFLGYQTVKVKVKHNKSPNIIIKEGGISVSFEVEPEDFAQDYSMIFGVVFLHNDINGGFELVAQRNRYYLNRCICG